MTVTAKFKVQRVTPNTHHEGAEVELVPDYAGDRNKDWSKWTPSGVIRMNITNGPALDQFEEGQAFTITFEKSVEETGGAMLSGENVKRIDVTK